MRDEHDQWYWDLERGVAVPASERGFADHMLGPYPSRFEAENWKRRVDERNDAWDEADEAWRGDEHEDGDVDGDGDGDGDGRD